MCIVNDATDYVEQAQYAEGKTAMKFVYTDSFEKGIFEKN